MILIEDTGRIARVNIDGTEWYMSSEEYHIMKRRSFHFWPYNLKRLNPEPHSCARCLNRPIDFCTSDKRMIMHSLQKCPIWSWSQAAPFYDNSDCEAGEWL